MYNPNSCYNVWLSIFVKTCMWCINNVYYHKSCMKKAIRIFCDSDSHPHCEWTEWNLILIKSLNIFWSIYKTSINHKVMWKLIIGPKLNNGKYISFTVNWQKKQRFLRPSYIFLNVVFCIKILKRLKNSQLSSALLYKPAN